MDAVGAAEAAAIGLAGGVAGGVFGVGGGVIMIPLMTIAFGTDPHLYQAASLATAIAISAGSIPRHIRAGAIDVRFAARASVVSLVTVALGVWISNRIDSPVVLERIFAAFLAYVAASELWGAVRHAARDRAPGADGAPSPATRPTAAVASLVGGIMGLLAGLLGLGGGVVAVPLLRTLGRFPIRQAIATSAAMVLLTVLVGAVLKMASLWTLPHEGMTPSERLSQGLVLAALLAPGGLIGARFGAQLTHRLPLRPLTAGFAAICLMLALRMAGLW